MTPLPADVAEVIDGYCRAVDAAIGERGVDHATRAQIADDLRGQVHEMLAASPGTIDAAKARTVIARLDAPADYARQWAREPGVAAAPIGAADTRSGALGPVALGVSIGGFVIAMIAVLVGHARGAPPDIAGMIYLGTQLIAFVCGLSARRTPSGRAALICSAILSLLLLILVVNT
ncbi:MAG TPA: hypothetical protein VEL07_02675 [Planctomycetota bacterium]|nr:hypothetical protein [Planctomycetota bacterium]